MMEDRQKLREILKVKDEDEDLEKTVIKCYYNMNKCKPTRAREILIVIKSFVSQIYIKRAKLGEQLEKEGKVVIWKKKKGNRKEQLENEMLEDKAEEKNNEDKSKNTKRKRWKNTGKGDKKKIPEYVIQDTFGTT